MARTIRQDPSVSIPPDLDLGDDGDALAILDTKPVGMPKTVRIVIDESDAIPPTGLPLGHNGRAYIIRPGEEVEVPEGVIGILDDARMSVPKIDGATKRVAGWSDRPRFSYRVVRRAA